MRGIVLAGGTGSRLHPITLGISKQLVPVYDKPMIYYPLSTLMLAGIRDILIITTPHDAEQFERLLGDGSQFGISLTYAQQPSPDGLAQAFVIGEEHIGSETAALVLGDNIFYGQGMGTRLRRHESLTGAAVFGYWVADPSAYGVVEFDASGRALTLEEKPDEAAQPLCDPRTLLLRQRRRRDREAPDALAPRRAGDHRPESRLPRARASCRSRCCREERRGSTRARSTPSARPPSSSGPCEKRQGLSIGSPEEVAWRLGFLSDDELRVRAEPLVKSGYGAYLLEILAQGRHS